MRTEIQILYLEKPGNSLSVELQNICHLKAEEINQGCGIQKQPGDCQQTTPLGG